MKVKGIDLKSSQHIQKFVIVLTRDVNCNYCDDHFVIHMNTESLWYTFETNISITPQKFFKMWIAYWTGQLYALYTDKTAKKKKDLMRQVSWSCSWYKL